MEVEEILGKNAYHKGTSETTKFVVVSLLSAAVLLTAAVIYLFWKAKRKTK